MNPYLKFKIGLILVPILLLLVYSSAVNNFFILYLIPILIVFAFIYFINNTGKFEVDDLLEEQKNNKVTPSEKEKSLSTQCIKCGSSHTKKGMVEVGNFPQAFWDSGVYFKSKTVSGKIPLKALCCLECRHVELII